MARKSRPITRRRKNSPFIRFVFAGASLQICGKSPDTCCGENSEPQLMTASRSLYDDKLQTPLITLSGMYKEKAAKFDGKPVQCTVQFTPRLRGLRSGTHPWGREDT